MRFGNQNHMAEVKLENCRHGTDGCFVSKGDVTLAQSQPDGTPESKP
jgi:hypothetical protein